MKKYYKIIFWLIWLAFVFVGPYTIIKNSRLDLVFSSPGLTIVFFQRMTGVLAFILFFLQIVLGANMPKLKQILGDWLFEFHGIEGLFTFFLFLLHPILYLLYYRSLYHVIDPFYVFTQVCLICKKTEIIYSLGRVSFWLGGLAVVAALFRDAPGWLSKNWRKIHIINYLVFFLMAIHGWFADSDFHLSPLKFIYWFSIIVVILTLFFECGRSHRQRKISE